MDPKTVRWLCRRLMIANGLGGWKFAWLSGKRYDGLCREESQTICLSKPNVVKMTPNEVLDLICHELGHGIRTYDKNAHLDDSDAHSKHWRAVYTKLCRVYGIRPRD